MTLNPEMLEATRGSNRPAAKAPLLKMSDAGYWPIAGTTLYGRPATNHGLTFSLVQPEGDARVRTISPCSLITEVRDMQEFLHEIIEAFGNGVD